MQSPTKTTTQRTEYRCHQCGARFGRFGDEPQAQCHQCGALAGKVEDNPPASFIPPLTTRDN